MSKLTYGFEISYQGKYGSTGCVIQLPHQCGSWMVGTLSADDDETSVMDEPPHTKDEAIKCMEQFIREAQEALELLRIDAGPPQSIESIERMAIVNE